MKTVYAATTHLLRPHVATMRANMIANRRERPTRARRHPTAIGLWQRFVRAMVTAQSRIDDDFWVRLDRSSTWRDLLRDGPSACTSVSTIAKAFGEGHVRFPAQKAERVVKGAKRDFDALATAARATLAENHDRGRRRETLRHAEIELAERVQDELRGCGVAPKIARLMLTGTDLFDHLVPIDSRWVSALADRGVDVQLATLATETTYREVEDEIARAAYDLGAMPIQADGVAFGWLLGSLTNGGTR